MPTPLIALGLYTRRHDAPDGSAFFAAWLASDGSIQIRYKPNANFAWSAAAAITGPDGTALAFADGGFDLSVGYSGDAPLVLTATEAGASGPSEWVSRNGAAFDPVT